MATRKIFISHSEKNRELAGYLVDLLETGIGISSSDVFCTSLEGMKIPSGVNFVNFIREQITSPEVVILLLTPDYLRSQFCLCELGASWALSNKTIPLLVKPTTYSDMKSVLAGVQGLKIDEESDLNQMQEELIVALGISGKSFSIWEVKRNDFLRRVSTLIPLPNVGDIPRAEFEKVVKNYKDAQVELQLSVAELEKKDRIISEIAALKSREEVKQILSEETSTEEEFDELVENASKALSALPWVVQHAFYHSWSGHLYWQTFDRDDRKLVEKAIEDDYMVDNDPELSLNEDDPKIERALKALNALEKFIDSEVSQEFCNDYKEKHDHLLKFSSKRFWDEHLL